MRPLKTTDTAPPSTPSDALIREYLTRHEAELHHYAYRMINRMRLVSGAAAQELARDVVQDLAEEALSCAARYDPARPIDLWLRGIIKNLIMRHRGRIWTDNKRTAYQRNGSAEEDAEFFDRAVLQARGGPATDPETELARREEATKLLATLDPPHREAVEALHVLELSSQEGAERLGISSVNVRVRAHRAIKQLQALLTKGGAR